MGKKCTPNGNRNRRSRHRHDEIPLPGAHPTIAKGTPVACGTHIADEEDTQPNWTSIPSSLDFSAVLDFGDGEENGGCITSESIADKSPLLPDDLSLEHGNGFFDDFADEAEETANLQDEEFMSCSTAQALVSADCLVEEAASASEGHSCSALGEIVLSNWRVLWAFVLTNGSRKLTKEQYKSVRNLAHGLVAMTETSWKTSWSPNEVEARKFGRKFSVLPHYSTLHKRFKPLVLNFLAPLSVEHIEYVDETKAGARHESRSQNGEAEITVRTILPSEYARADMASPAVWSEMRSTSLSYLEECGEMYPSPAVSSRECIDILPIIGARRWFYGPQKVMYLDVESPTDPLNTTRFAEFGDTVSVELLGVHDLNENVRRCFGVDNVLDNSARVRGVFAHSWTVHESRRDRDLRFRESYDYDISSRDKEIADVFNYLKYRSPTDAVRTTIPPLPVQSEYGGPSGDADEDEIRRKNWPEMVEASKRRRAAVRERNCEIDAAWRSWQKPILKPSDFVVLLRPCIRDELAEQIIGPDSPATLLTDVDRASRLCVVHRFWVEREERSRHVFFVPGGADLSGDPRWVRDQDPSLLHYCTSIENGSVRRYGQVRSVQLEKEHGGPRGTQLHRPLSSIGVLDSGDLYFVYRIILFWDAFNIQSGKSASGEGLYMLCLNLPVKARSSPSAVRILSLTPPGVKGTDVLQHIMRDIVKGATEGFMDYDAEGTKRRIILDLVGVVGDTPALNGTLDVLGHTAISCCHLCRFRRLSTTSVGAKYTNCNGHGAHSAFRRGFFQHAAIHDCEAQHETCRLLGIKSNPDVSNLPLHGFSSAMNEAMSRIPTVRNGVPIVPHDFDPYMASFIAPDHLLTGHLKDCITLVLKLLPSSRYLKTCERVMVSFLAQAGLPPQNRLFDHDKKSVYSMSMSDLYALGVVAELGFLCGCAEEESTGNSSYSVRDSCKSAIQLVGSCASLISEIWRKPDEQRDGKLAVRLYETNHGISTITRIQRMVENHIQKVDRLCVMSDEDKEAFDDARCSRQRKAELSMIYRTAVIATKTVDKPNIHRLREMVYTTLPMLGHISIIGELVLEKAHQRLKRALKQSNNKDGQLLSMQSISLDDWQGRLTLVIADCFARNDRALLCCYRLLAGREVIHRMDGKLSESLKIQVRSALGPEVCIRAELEMQCKSVISPRSETIAVISWSLKGAVRRIPLASQTMENSQLAIEHYARMAFGNEFSRNFVRIGYGISSTVSKGTPGPSFRRGDIVETLCCRPHNAEYHFPFLLQPNCSSCFSGLVETSAASIWCLTHILTVTDNDGGILPGRAKFYAAVQPCVLENYSESQQGPWNTAFQKFDEYRVQITGKISFAQIDTSMRKVGVIRPNILGPAAEGSSEVSHAVLNGEIFLALTRTMGYSPRKG